MLTATAMVDKSRWYQLARLTIYRIPWIVPSRKNKNGKATSLLLSLLFSSVDSHGKHPLVSNVGNSSILFVSDSTFFMATDGSQDFLFFPKVYIAFISYLPPYHPSVNPELSQWILCAAGGWWRQGSAPEHVPGVSQSQCIPAELQKCDANALKNRNRCSSSPKHAWGLNRK